MTITVAMFSLLLGLALIACGIRALWANEQTYKDRMRLLKWVFADHWLWQYRSSTFEGVAYDAHLWSRFLMRDPWVLYGPEIREAMKERERGQ